MPSISDHPEIRVTSPSHHGRVALVATPGGELYGSDRMAVATVVALRAAGWGVVVTMPETGPLADTMRRAGARVEICPTARLRKSALRPLGTARLGIELLLSLRRSWGLLRAIRPTVVYVNTVTVPSWLGLARAQGIPTICHVHEAKAWKDIWSAGQGVGAIRQIEPVSEILDLIRKEYLEALRFEKDDFWSLRYAS